MQINVDSIRKVLKVIPPDMRGYVIGAIFTGAVGYFKYQQDVGDLRHENELLRLRVTQLEKRGDGVDRKLEGIERKLEDLAKKEDLNRKFDTLQRENSFLREKFYELSLGVQLRTELAKVTNQVKEAQQSEGIIVGRVKDFLNSLKNAKTPVEAEEIIENFRDDPQEPIGEDGDKAN